MRNSELLRAQQAILTPKTRLEAGNDMVTGASPARAEKIVALLSTAPPREIAVALLDGVYGIPVKSKFRSQIYAIGILAGLIWSQS